MKPARFSYFAPSTLDEAIGALKDVGSDAKLLGGGQSLVPLLNMRLVRPRLIVDLNKIDQLGYIDADDGNLRIGAMTRGRALEGFQGLDDGWPLVAKALPYVGHPPIRTRGTVGGSVAHADPAAELPAAFAALGAEVVVSGPGGRRRIPMTEFYITYFTTVCEPEEIVTEIAIPRQKHNAGSAVVELARRQGDFALGGIVATLCQASDNKITESSVWAFAAADRPLRLSAVEDLLAGERLSAELLAEVAERTRSTVEPEGDVHGSTDYRRKLLGVLAKRAVEDAVHDARTKLQ